MNFNTSPIAFFPARDAQDWRVWYAQRKISIICGENLLPFYIIDNGSAPAQGELYEPNTNTKVADITLSPYLLDHTITVDGQSRHIWIYQGGLSGVFGYANAGYYYLKIGSWYSDIFKIGALPKNYVSVSWQFYDDIITVDGTPLSKNVQYEQIFETNLWHPTYEVTEEGKTNNGVFFAMSQTTKKQCGFQAIANECQIDCLNLTRMADIITIKACTNGIIKTLQTNQFEIKSKWESDDVASIDCTFDLFNIIRKYQQSNVAPEPLPIPTPPTPPTPSNYYIKGTVQSGTNSVQLKINGTTTSVQCVNGAFEYGYDSPLTSLETCTYNNGYIGLSNVDKIKTLDLSDSCMFTQATTVRLGQMSNCTSINFGNCTFANVTTADGFCADNTKLASVSIPEATFASLTEDTWQMFAGCSNLTSVSLPKSVQAYGAQALFSGCTKLATINMPLATFASTAYAGTMFQQCTSLDSVTLTAATFASATNFAYMFQGAQGWYDDDMSEYAINFGTVFPACTAQPTTIAGMFQNAKFNSINLSALDLSACTDMLATFENSSLRGLTMNASQFATVTNFKNTFKNCKYLNSTSTTLINGIAFGAATTCESMFAGSGGGPADNITFDAGTFANVTTCKSMFEGSAWKKIAFKRNVADFSNCTDISRMYYNYTKVTEIDMAIGSTFSQITAESGMANMFDNCTALVTLYTPQNSELNVSLYIRQSTLLDDASFISLCQWMADRTGLSPKIAYVSATAYNNLSGTTQTNVNNYLTSKGWSMIML